MTSIDDYADVSNADGESIAVWERVSTDMTRQDIKSQTADLRAFIGAGSYRVERVFRFEASAFHGKHVPEQAEMLADVEAGRYLTVVAAMSSRYERRGVKHALRFALDLDLYGARVIAIDDPSYGDMSSELGIIGTVFKAKSNFEYSKAISDNVNRANRLRDAQGVHRGASISGYVITGAKGAKQLEMHPDAAGIVAQAFADCTTGKSTPKIARTFKAANERYGLKLPETPDGVAKMLRMREYSAGRHGEGHACQCRFTPLVSPAQQDAAVTAMDARTTGDNVSSRAISKDDYSGALWCAACGLGRLYRYYGGGRKRKDGSLTPRARRYQCDNPACHKSVKADSADAEIARILSSDPEPWWDGKNVDPNAERDMRIREIDAELASLPVARTPADRISRREVEDTLYAERDTLAAIPSRPRQTFTEIRKDASGKGLTRGDQWRMMTPPERRDSLTAEGSEHAFVRTAGDRSGAVVVEFRPDDQERAV